MIIGFPCDEGVYRNGGRPGAAGAPDAIRCALYRMLPDPDVSSAFTDTIEHVLDLGNVVLTGRVSESQERLGEILAPYLADRVFAIVLGGGHETSFGHFLGYALAGRSLSILNWDAHTDVRETIDGEGHSGSPFRQAMLHPSRAGRKYTVAGLQPQSVSRSHLDFIGERGGAWMWCRDLTSTRVASLYRELSGPSMVSFDMDAVDQSLAPGVSAPTAGGMTGELWLQAAYCAGQTSAVSSVDLVEVNPLLDRDDQTVRFSALTLWTILRGLADRPPEHGDMPRADRGSVADSDDSLSGRAGRAA